MPASKHTRRASTPKKASQHNRVYSSSRARGDSKGTAIKKASGVLKKQGKRRGY